VPAARIGHQAVQGWPAFLGSRHRVVDVFNCDPTTAGSVLARLEELVVGRLTVGGYARIERRSMPA
jgi:hypothetical protein